ncbi:MAG: NUDIX domain-containing protein [Chitinophagaceae bacterium]|nr:NUDIX domain-containing protein [Chitinophagaceae bacterium]
MGLKTIKAAGGLVLNEKQEILMIFRRGKWDLPKGKLDEGEKIEECAVREVMEETGLTKLNLGSLITITHHTYFDTWLKEEVIKETHWFLMEASSAERMIPQISEDIEIIEWVSIHNLNQHLSNSYDTIVAVVKNYQNRY